jgi:Kef-type K+ transport system membrane component KefB
LGGLVVAKLTGTGHVAVYAVLLASGSAAVVLTTLQERKLDGPDALIVIAQVTVADVAAILTVPLVLQPSRAGDAAVGALLITGCALSVFFVARCLRLRPWVHELRKRSKQRGWALDLRLSLAVLFGLAWIAQQSGTSVLLGGFGMGLVVAAIGGPKRLSTQVRGVAEGFFVPLFFVVLGARLDVRALVDHPDLLVVTVALIVLNVVIHALAALATRQPWSTGLIASAQLGVPAAVVQIGLQQHVITPALGAAVILAALATLALCILGTDLFARRTEPPPALPGAPRNPSARVDRRDLRRGPGSLMRADLAELVVAAVVATSTVPASARVRGSVREQPLQRTRQPRRDSREPGRSACPAARVRSSSRPVVRLALRAAGAGGRWLGCRGDGVAHEVDRVGMLQALLAHERAPGRERQRVPDGSPGSGSDAATQWPAGDEHLARGVEVAQERSELVLHGGHRLGVPDEVGQHLLDAPVIGIELAQRALQALGVVGHCGPRVQVGQGVLCRPVSRAGGKQGGLVGEVAIQRRASDAGMSGDGAHRRS